MPDRLILTLDGATRACSAALLRQREPQGPYEVLEDLWEVMAGRLQRDGRGQGRILLRAVDDMLHEVGGRAADLRAIVVGTGPGTFTGVRIAVATARALSLALAVPVVGVSTLSALAARVARGGAGGSAVADAAGPELRPLLVPVVDARRDQVFFGLYKAVGGAEVRRWLRSGPFGVCDRGALLRMVEAPAVVVAEDEVLVGKLPDGVQFVAAEVAAEHLVLGQEFLTEPGDPPQGSLLTPWLVEAVVAGAAVTPEAVKPIYVRSPDADIHITKKKDPWAEGPAERADRPGR